MPTPPAPDNTATRDQELVLSLQKWRDQLIRINARQTEKALLGDRAMGISTKIVAFQQDANPNKTLDLREETSGNNIEMGVLIRYGVFPPAEIIKKLLKPNQLLVIEVADEFFERIEIDPLLELANAATEPSLVPSKPDQSIKPGESIVLTSPSYQLKFGDPLIPYERDRQKTTNALGLVEARIDYLKDARDADSYMGDAEKSLVGIRSKNSQFALSKGQASLPKTQTTGVVNFSREATEDHLRVNNSRGIISDYGIRGIGRLFTQCVTARMSDEVDFILRRIPDDNQKISLLTTGLDGNEPPLIIASRLSRIDNRDKRRSTSSVYEEDKKTLRAILGSFTAPENLRDLFLHQSGIGIQAFAVAITSQEEMAREMYALVNKYIRVGPTVPPIVGEDGSARNTVEEISRLVKQSSARGLVVLNKIESGRSDSGHAAQREEINRQIKSGDSFLAARGERERKEKIDFEAVPSTRLVEPAPDLEWTTRRDRIEEAKEEKTQDDVNGVADKKAPAAPAKKKGFINWIRRRFYPNNNPLELRALLESQTRTENVSAVSDNSDLDRIPPFFESPSPADYSNSRPNPEVGSRAPAEVLRTPTQTNERGSS